MIDFDKYNIKIRFFAIHPAGINPINNEPFIVKRKVWWNERIDFKTEQEYFDAWDAIPENAHAWCELHAGQTLIVHELTPHGIRYAIDRSNQK
jgi:hypothetical protein